MSETRKLAAILVSDVVGYSRLAGADEERTLARLRPLRSDLIDPTIALHHGRVVKRTGDGTVIEFRSVVDAVRCAIEVQSGMVERNAGVPPEKRIEFRVGIHLGDVVEESDGDLMGDGVNIAARLEGICEPGGIVLSGAAHEHARDRVKEEFVDLGEKALKNIARTVLVKARRHFDRALELDSDNVDALVRRAWVDHTLAGAWLSEDRFERLRSAETDVGKALRMRPDHAGAHCALGATQILTERADQGIAECERALTIDPNFASAHA